MTIGYVFSSVLLAIATALFTFNGIRFLLPPHGGSDATAIILVTTILIGYSLLPKPDWLNRLNFLVVPLGTLTFIVVASQFEPQVGEGVGYAVMFAIFTFFVPFLIYIAIIVTNLYFCLVKPKANHPESLD